MIHGFNFDENDPNYKLLIEIFKIIDYRESKQIMARNGLKPLSKVIPLVKTIFISLFFECDISFVVEELKNKSELREGLNFEAVLEAQEIYDRLSRVDPVKLENTVNSILNKLRNDYNRGRRIFIIDATPGDLNINFHGKKISKEKLADKDYAWGWGTSIGFYIGYKITLVLDYKTKMPVYFIVDRGSPNDTTMVSKILPILQRKKIIRKGDIILMDRGYYSYKNYKLALQKYHVIPLILTRSKFNKEKLKNMLNYPLHLFHAKSNLNKVKKAYKKLVDEFFENIDKRDKIKFHRGYIEDYFKLLKKGLGFKQLNRYTLKSMKKYTSLAVLLSGIITHLLIGSKTDFQKFSEGKFY